MPESKITVTARCVVCRTTREIGPGEVAPGEVPMCAKCFAPMVAESATAQKRV